MNSNTTIEEIKTMKKNNILLAFLCTIPLFTTSCNKQNTIQEEIAVLENNGCFFLNKTFQEIYDKLGCRKFYDIYSEELKYTGKFEYSKTVGKTEVYTAGAFNGQETMLYFRDGINVGFSTRDPQFGLSLFGCTIGSPSHGYITKFWDDSVVAKFHERGWVYDYQRLEKEYSELSVLDINPPINTPHRYMYYQNKLHVNYGMRTIESLGWSMISLEVYLDE